MECNLQDYPSAEEVKEAWKEGIIMAKNLACRLGMHPDGDEDNDDRQRDDGDDDDQDGGGGDDGGGIADEDERKWFDSPMTYVDFKDSLKGMAIEEELEDLGQNVDQNDDENEEAIVNDNSDPEKNKATMTVPGVGVRYKSTVIAKLRNNPNLSLDCLRRIRDACAASRQSNSTMESSTDVLCLFDDCALHFPAQQNHFVLGQVQRMKKKKAWTCQVHSACES